MAEIVILDTPLTRWQMLCAAVRLCQEEPTESNRRAVSEAETRYNVSVSRSRSGDAA